MSISIKNNTEELQELLQKVNDLPNKTNGVELPTLDNQGTADDLANGKELIDANGIKVTGALPVVDDFIQVSLDKLSSSGSTLGIQSKSLLTKRSIVETNVPAIMSFGTGEFGNALATDVATGKTFTSSAGFKVEGNLPVVNNFTPSVCTKLTSSGNVIGIQSGSLLTQRSIVESGVKAAITVSGNEFGNAVASDVAKGVTFTSAAGLLVEGTHECDDSGIDTTVDPNSAATSKNILVNKIAYVNGEQVVGTAENKMTALYSYSATPNVEGSGLDSNPYFITLTHSPGKETMVRDKIVLGAYSDKFGTATADDVAKGKTFTSVSGLLVEGKHECDPGFTLPELDPDKVGTSSDLASGKELIGADGSIITGTATILKSGSIAHGSAVSDVTIGTYSSSRTLSVSRYTSVSAPDGTITGTSNGSIVFSSSAGTSAFDNIKKCYINVSNNWYYVPSTATCSSTGSYSYTVKFSGINPVFILAEV